jgi:hypothetical protein
VRVLFRVLSKRWTRRIIPCMASSLPLSVFAREIPACRVSKKLYFQAKKRDTIKRQRVD